ncbi:hypothetical protein SDC9_86602 [bioreactor metagenome]|uniref:Uncharacterized protein n=1 Tax=bioreactor metagenome TaxID=1076179 RepID=A0A644ZGF1_9ZZZZ
MFTRLIVRVDVVSVREGSTASLRPLVAYRGEVGALGPVNF